MHELGEKVTNFTLSANGGAEVSLSDYAGKNVVIYFYPKDDTSGCTTEALDFTAQLDAFDATNTVILGVSKDSVKKHDNFIKKHDLGVTLLADIDGTLCESFGVWVEKKMYGRSYMGIERATYLIDATGVVRQIWRKVKVKGHVAEVLEAARAL